MTPTTIITLAELAVQRDAWAAAGARVAFVPTMGALHQGHLSLVKMAQSLADQVVVSIFVNPTQFGPNEDLAKYPRTLKGDLELLSGLEVGAVFLPNTATIYPDGFQTYVHNKGMAEDLDGVIRPGHFDGVLTVVLKLFNLVQPHVAVFGKKDYQQWRVIERMALDLNLPLQIVGAEILRDADGLALSSRNRYLSDTERALAVRLCQGLTAAKEVFKAGSREPKNVVDACRQVLGDVAGIALEYSELRRQHDLTPFAGKIDAPCVLLVAGRVGSTRLIDNMEMD